MEISAEIGKEGGSGILMLHLLGRCNLKCLHCYMDGSPLRREELPLDLVVGALAECGKLGIGSVYLTGGEPLLYRGLREVLMAARIPGVQVTLSTNGILMTERRAALLREVGVRTNISIDGEAAFHDHFRALPGAFSAAEKGVRTLVKIGVPVTIVTTISRDNLHSLPRIAQWAAEAGAVQFRVQPLLKLGRGTEIADERLTTEQMNRLVLQLSDLASLYRTRGMGCCINGVSRRFLEAHPCGAYVCNGAGCHRRVAREIKKLVVREDGTVLPEATNLSHEFALGKIQDGPLSMLVSRYFEHGYDKFDQLCRTTYAEVIPTWESAVVPWDQIVAERSHNWIPGRLSETVSTTCGACLPN
jgi:MoaA/NifB/PqqE/SkfB family radical SAM enzyme